MLVVTLNDLPQDIINDNVNLIYDAIALFAQFEIFILVIKSLGN